MTAGHGGPRPGAGRPPKALRYAQQTAAAEGKLLGALPEMIDRLVTAARGGDMSCARYLVDRVLGRTALQAAALPDDYRMPSDHPAATYIHGHQRHYQLARELTEGLTKEGFKLLLEEVAFLEDLEGSALHEGNKGIHDALMRRKESLQAYLRTLDPDLKAIPLAAE